MQQNSDLEAEWANDMDNMSMVSETSIHSDLQFQTLLDTRKRAQQQLLLERKTENSKILNLWKNLEENNKEAIEQFEGELPELKRIIKNEENNVIQQSLIEEIRGNLVMEVQLREEVEYEEPVVKQPSSTVAGSVKDQTINDSEVLEDKEVIRMREKMQRMFEERETIGMQREDERSLQHEVESHRALFNRRFFTPSLKTVRQNSQPISFALPTAVYTYTNLCPQANNQSNTFSKHSPVIALQSLKKLSRIQVKPIKSVVDPITAVLKPKIENTAHISKSAEPLKLALSPAILEHFTAFSKSIPKLEQVTASYQSKFINDHLDEEERGQNFSLADSSQEAKSLDSFLETVTSYDKVKELKITFQNLSDIKYIETLKNLEYVCLKHNRLVSVEQIINNQNIIELNLSHNRISSMEGIQYLKGLRHLNLEQNQIQSLVNLQCPYLEILAMSNNGIRRIGGLDNTLNLRRLDVSHNKLQDLRGLGNLRFLNHLNAQHNTIQEVKGIENCLLLKSLLLSHNRIHHIQSLAYIFLNALALSNNFLTSLPEMFLPSLQELYIDSNKLKQSSPDLLLPRLKKINLDHNSFQSFSPIWNLLKNSLHCEVVKYDNNQELNFMPVAMNELYEFMVCKRMDRLEILNQNPCNIGTRMYFQSQYSNLLSTSPKTSNPHDLLMSQLSSQISSIINQNKFIEWVESNKHQFRKNSHFIRNKSTNMVENLKKICAFVKGRQSVFVEIEPVYYQYDLYELKKKAALEKIRGIVVMEKYRKEKRRKYLLKNKDRIQQYLRRILEDGKAFRIRQAVLKFSAVFGEGNKHSSMTLIKHCYKRFKDRTKFLKLIENLKANKKKSIALEQEDELQEINLDFLDKNYDYSTRITVPSHMNFESLIYRPEVFEKAQEIVQNAMIYQQSDTSSNIGSMQNTSSSNALSLQSGANLNARFPSKSKKKSLPPINYKEETQKVIQAMRLEGEVTDKVRMQIQEGIRQKHRRKAQNQKGEKYAYQKMQRGSVSKRG